MRVFTPGEIAEHNQSKYQGVLVAAKYARELNVVLRGEAQLEDQKKLSTRALEAITSGQVDYRLVKRRRPEDE
jgi:DNA-directed RNA polymerase omega subunit